MKSRIEFILLKIYQVFFRLLGLNISRKSAFLFAALFYYLIPIRKNTVIENLKLAFPEWNIKKVKKVTFQNYKSVVITLIEILFIPYLSREEAQNLVDCVNTELITEKYRQNKGVVLLSAHFGNWEYIAISIALQIGIPVSVIVKPQRNPFVTKTMDNFRTKWGNKVVPLGISVRQVYKELKEKNIVAMVADQRGPREGIRVTFFDRDVSVYSGPAMLALKTGAPVLYGIPIRQKDYSYKTEMVEISTDNLPDGEDEKIRQLSQRHTSYLESIIRKHPEQWLWMHKRWKY